MFKGKRLLDHKLTKMCTLYNCYVPCLLDYLKSFLKSESRLPISEFSGYHCIKLNNMIVLGKHDKIKRYFFKTLIESDKHFKKYYYMLNYLTEKR